MTAIVLRRPGRLAPRLLWLIPGIALGVYANVVAGQHALGLVPVLVFGIVPHLAVFAGTGQPHAAGQLAPRAVPLYNAMHRPALPLALLAVAAVGLPRRSGSWAPWRGWGASWPTRASARGCGRPTAGAVRCGSSDDAA